MSGRTIRLVIAAVLLVHGLGHGIAAGALVFMHGREEAIAGLRAAQSWLLPSLSPVAATTLATTISVLALVGFVAATMAFWGVLVPGGAWRRLAVVSAIVSTVGIVLFFGAWLPLPNTLAALGVNVAVLVALLGLHWPPRAMFGRYDWLGVGKGGRAGCRLTCLAENEGRAPSTRSVDRRRCLWP